MILSDREIWIAVKERFINIDPLPDPGQKGWSSTAIDLHLDSEIRPWNAIEGAGMDAAIDPAHPKFNTNQLIATHTVPESCNAGYRLRPGAFVLGWTVEKVKFPHTSRMAARIEGKSSLARIGLGVHITAPTIHAGFGVKETDPTYPGSQIRLEIWNAGPLEIKLTEGLAICQLIIEEVHGTPAESYRGQFAVQGPDSTVATPPRPQG